MNHSHQDVTDGTSSANLLQMQKLFLFVVTALDSRQKSQKVILDLDCIAVRSETSHPKILDTW